MAPVVYEQLVPLGVCASAFYFIDLRINVAICYEKVEVTIVLLIGGLLSP